MIIDAGQIISQYVRRRLRDNKCDFTWSQIKVMQSVGNHEGLSQVGVTDDTDVDRSTLADVVRRLIRAGMLQRRRTKEDARTYALKLTSAGADALASALPLLASIEEELAQMAPSMRKASTDLIKAKKRLETDAMKS